MHVLGIDRILVATPDLNEATERYGDVFATEFVDLDDLANPTAGESFSLSETGLEFIEPGSEDDDVARFLERNGPGVYAVGYRVADSDEAKAHLAEQGIEPIQTEYRENFTELFYHPRDFSGVMTIFTEIKVPHPTVVAADPEIDHVG
jgi:methylmalonyl-CoA/ethylmalonyl-CoA epimerase